MDKQDKYDNGHADTDTVIDPFLTGQCQCCNSGPVTDLAAEVCSQNSQNGVGHFIFVIKSKKQYKRNVNNERIDLFRETGSIQYKRKHIKNTCNTRKS